MGRSVRVPAFCGATKVFRNWIEEIEMATNKDWATAA